MSSGTSVLTAADLANFREYGFVHLTDCFDTAPGSLAHRWVAETWVRNGLPPDDLSKWPVGKIHMPNSELRLIREISPKAFAAICELVGGEDRLIDNPVWGNGMIANYGMGRDKPWIPPSPEMGGWHVDGDFFLHFLDSAEQGLLLVILWSDIHPQGGGTFIACDSVPHIARWLAAHPEGVEPNGFEAKRQILNCHDLRETTGKAGDVFLLHPFTLHTSSYNHRPEARFMTNPSIILREPMRLDRRADGSAYSPVEQVTLAALGLEHSDFKPTMPRRRIVPGRVAHQQALLEQEKERLATASPVVHK